MRPRGIEPRAQEWKPCMLPLHQGRFFKSDKPDLNKRPIGLQPTALPTELLSVFLATINSYLQYTRLYRLLLALPSSPLALCCIGSLSALLFSSLLYSTRHCSALLRSATFFSSSFPVLFVVRCSDFLPVVNPSYLTRSIY